MKECLYKDMNGLSKYTWSIHNNLINYLYKDTNGLCPVSTGVNGKTLTNAYLSKYMQSIHNN
jgi:hypothetical protein